MNVLFVASKEASYPRVALIAEILEENHSGITLSSSLSNYVLRLSSIAIQLGVFFFRGRFSEVQVVLVGFLAQLTVPLVRLFWKGPLVVDAFILLYDTLVEDRKWLKPECRVAKWARRLDFLMLRSSNVILTDTQANASWLMQEFGVEAEKIYVLPAGARENIFKPTGLSNPAQRRTNYEILFWGSYLPLHGVPTILKAANLLRSEEVQFTLVGSGQTFAQCRELARALNLTQVSFLNDMSPHELAALASSQDLILGIFGGSKKASRVIPNKVYEAWSLGKPVITEDSPAIRELVNGEEDCILVPPEDPEALANAIRWAIKHPEEMIKTASNGHRIFQQKASQTCLKKKLNEAINKAVRERNQP